MPDCSSQTKDRSQLHSQKGKQWLIRLAPSLFWNVQRKRRLACRKSFTLSKPVSVTANTYGQGVIWKAKTVI